MKRQAKIVLAVLLMTLVVFVGQSSAQEMGRYIVTIEGPPGLAEKAVIRAGGVVNHVYNIIPAIAIQIPEQALEGLKRNPNVVRIESDAMVYAITYATELEDSWGVEHIGAGTVHDGSNKGEGVNVAVLDTGIDKDHPDLESNIAGGINFVRKGRSVDTSAWDDDNGHGTHCAGIIAALKNEEGVVGVAPEASLYGVKVLGKNGSGWVSDIIAGLNWCVSVSSDKMDIVNMSLGGDVDVQAFCDACEEAEDAGVVLVAAAGNSGGAVIYPAAYDSVIAVAATDSDDTRPSWSCYGDEIELAAPGVGIYSTYKDGGYATYSGTSMSSPHVAGTAALAIAAGVTDVRGTLVATAEDLGVEGLDPYYGHGLVDAAAAAGVSEEPPEPTHDVAVTSITAPSTVVEGDVVGVDVTVANEGTYDETFTLTLTDETDGVFIIGSAAVSLAAGASTTIAFDWDTTNSSLGDHFLKAEASVVVGETDTADNSMPITVNVIEAGGEMDIYVDIAMDLSTRTAGRNTFIKALATVTITDENGIEVEGATVYGDWSNATSDSDSGVTDSYGEVMLESDAVKNPSTGTMFTFTVYSVVKSGLEYIVDVSASKTIP